MLFNLYDDPDSHSWRHQPLQDTKCVLNWIFKRKTKSFGSVFWRPEASPDAAGLAFGVGRLLEAEIGRQIARPLDAERETVARELARDLFLFATAMAKGIGVNELSST